MYSADLKGPAVQRYPSRDLLMSINISFCSTESVLRFALTTMKVFPSALVLLCLAVNLYPAGQTVYRFLPYEGALAPPTVSNPISPAASLPPVSIIRRGSAEDPFEDLQYAEFDGTHYVEPQPFAGDYSLDEAFTVSVFIRFREFGPEQVMASSVIPDGQSGFRLKVDALGRITGQLVGMIEEGEPVTRSLTTDLRLVPGNWYRITYRFGRDSGESVPFHDIWINHAPACRQSLSGTFQHVTAAPPVLGAERGPEGMSANLKADVVAWEVDDYARSDLFLASPVVRDGSQYFGQIAFHDYLGQESLEGKLGGLPLERRIHETFFADTGAPRFADLAQRLESLWFIPFLNDNYVPQGLAIDQENRRIFLAYYHRTQDNIQYTHPSLIAEVHLPEGRLGNVFLLHDETGAPMTSHVGGIAYWNGFLFAPGQGDGTNLDPDLFVYDISEIPPASFNPATLEGFAPIELDASKRLRDPLSVLGPEGRFNSLSFMGVHYSADGQAYFHTGNFQQEPRPTHIFTLATEEVDGLRYPVLSDPVTLIQSHRRAQGMAFYLDVESNGRQIRRALLSNSYGDADSTLYSSLYVGDPEPAIGLPFLSLPAGMEDLGRLGTRLFTWFESGAIYYQKRDSNPWQQLFPFIAAIDMSDLIDTTGNRIPDEWYVHYKLPPAADPLSDPDGDGYSIREEFLWDTDPGKAGEHPWIRQTVRPVFFELPASIARFYTFEQSRDFIHWSPVP
jgi:hypothetical protein